MELTKKDIAEYQKIYKEKFGEEIDEQSSRTQLSKLVRQMEIVYQPISEQQRAELVRREDMKADAKALAELIYDVYQDKKQR